MELELPWFILNNMNEILQIKIELLKDVPGVYIMKNTDGEVIYVGKAKSLIKRVKQYFYRPQVGKVMRMVREIADFETIQINSEKEALLLELNLIRKYYPKYNILLKDGKTYPYISLSKDAEPVLKIAYKPNKDNNYYFGPYPSIGGAYKVMDLLNKIFPLRKCNTIPNQPCLYYHLNQCLGPCINHDLKAQYNNIVNDIRHFMNGDDENKIKKKMIEAMNQCADELNFEKAQEYKEIIEAIDHIQEKQAISLKDKTNMDVIAISYREGYFALSFLFYRRGLLLGKNTFVMEQDGDDNLEQIILLIFQYYQKHELPKEIIVGSKELSLSLESALEIKTFVPSRGIKKDLLLIALENAKNGLDEHFLSARLEDDNLVLLERLGSLLNIKTPLHIELFDNSHLQGSEPIGAMVAFINGVKTPSLYRKYNISQSDGKDDLKSMYEIISRRYSRLKNENMKYPDLILVDGGLNQILVAKRALKDIGVDIPVAGLSKDEHHHTSLLINEDEVFPLSSQDKLFLLLVRMQDEVHRFAISFHRNKRSKKLISSFFDDIKGVGIKTKEQLNRAYPSLDDLKSASVEEISQIVSRDIAERIIMKIKANK